MKGCGDDVNVTVEFGTLIVGSESDVEEDEDATIAAPDS